MQVTKMMQLLISLVEDFGQGVRRMAATAAAAQKVQLRAPKSRSVRKALRLLRTASACNVGTNVALCHAPPTRIVRAG
jgi:hypothetical protein